MNIINEFNETWFMFLDLIYTFTNDSDISFYKKAMNKIIQTQNDKIIDQFVIRCIPYHKEIYDKNKKFFVNLNLQNEFNNDDSLLKIIKIKEIFNNLDEDKINIIFEYLILLCNYSLEYLKTKKLN